MSERILFGVAAALASVVSLPATGRAEELKPSFAELLSPSAIFAFEIDDCPRTRERYHRMPRARFWWEGAGRRLIDGLVDATMGDGRERRMLDSFVALLDAFPGRFCLAYDEPLLEEEDEFLPVPFLLADGGGAPGKLSALLMGCFDEGFVEREEVELEGARFTDVGDMLVGASGDTVLAAYGRRRTAEMVRRLANRPWNNLTGNKAYQLARRRAGAVGADFSVFFNFRPIWTLVRADGFEDDVRLLDDSGLSQLDCVCQAGRFSDEGAVERLAFLLRDRSPGGFWKLLRGEPVSRVTWKGLPETSAGFVSFKLDLAARVEPFLDLLDRAFPEGGREEFVEPFEMFRGETGVAFDKDILTLTTGEMTFGFLEDPPEAANWPPDGRPLKLMFVAVELTDPDRAERVMTRLEQAEFVGGPAARRRRFGRFEGWALFDGSRYVFGHEGVAYLAVAPEPLVRVAETLTGRAGRLVDSREFKTAIARVPEGSPFVGYSNMREVLRSCHKMLQADMELAGEGPPGQRPEAVQLPPVEELFEGLTPLTASLEVIDPGRQKPGEVEQEGPAGFTFEMRSPHGFWSFYMQLAAHVVWKFEEEPRYLREKAARPVFEAAMAKLEATEDADAKIAILEDAAGKLRGTRYEHVLRQRLAGLMAEQLDDLLKREGREPTLRVQIHAGPGDPDNVMLMAGTNVMLMAGTNAGVVEGMTFTVYRGRRHVGNVVAKNVIGARMTLAEVTRLIDPEGLRHGDVALFEGPLEAAKLAADGKVLAVRPAVGLVMLSVGSEQGVRRGMKFVITRGDRTIATVVAEKVFADMTSARVTEPEKTRKIRENDDARPEDAEADGLDEEEDVF
jgi:hypothetical protein